MNNKSAALTSSYPRFFDNAPLVVACLLVVDSLHFVFARLMVPYLPPATSAFYVLGIATVEVTLLVWIRDQIRVDVFKRHVWFFLGIGFLVATSTSINYTAVAFIDPGTASLLGETAVLFGLGFGLIWLRERLVTLEIIGAVMAIIGIFIITYQPGDYVQIGSSMVLASAMLYALHAAVAKRYGTEIRLADFFLFRLMATTGFLLLFNIGRGELVWPGWQAGLILLLVGTVDVAIGRGLYYVSLRRLKLSLMSLILTVSPVLTMGWTLLLFGIRPAPRQLVGGVAVIAGVLMVTAGRLQMRN